MRIEVHILFEVRRKFFGDQRVNLRAACQAPPVESFLSQPLDNGNFGKGRKFPTRAGAPAFQCLDEVEWNSESFEWKASDPKSFFSGRNHRHTGETLCRANRS